MYTSITDKQLDEWKVTLAKSDITYDSDDDYREALLNLVGFFDVLIQIDLKQSSQKPSTQLSGVKKNNR